MSRGYASSSRMKFTNQLIFSQLKAIHEPETGEPRDKISMVLTECILQMYSDHQLPQMEVMNRIKQTFINLELLKGLKKSNVKQTIVRGPMTTRMRNTELALVVLVIHKVHNLHNIHALPAFHVGLHNYYVYT